MGDTNFVLRDQNGRGLFTASITSGNRAFIPFDEKTDVMVGTIEDRAVTAV